MDVTFLFACLPSLKKKLNMEKYSLMTANKRDMFCLEVFVSVWISQMKGKTKASTTYTFPSSSVGNTAFVARGPEHTWLQLTTWKTAICTDITYITCYLKPRRIPTPTFSCPYRAIRGCTCWCVCKRSNKATNLENINNGEKREYLLKCRKKRKSFILLFKEHQN